MVRVDFLGFRHEYDEKLLSLAMDDARALWVDNLSIGLPYISLVFAAYQQRYRDRNYTKRPATQGITIPAEDIQDLEEYLRDEGIRNLPPPIPPPVECTLCTDLVDPDTAGTRLRCGDTWHVRCVAELFEKTTVDEALFPPRCCQEIALADVQHVLSPELRLKFSAKSIEFRTLRRVYCAAPTCAAFLGAQTTASGPMTCPTCRRQTCSACKTTHSFQYGQTCEQNVDGEAMSHMVQFGWKRCPACGRFIERTQGCNHMTCLCKKEFCYVCNAGWVPRACSCPLFTR